MISVTVSQQSLEAVLKKQELDGLQHIMEYTARYQLVPNQSWL